MNILLISQCNKRALVESRRILDLFAERKGDRCWQTAITWQGQQTLRKLLRKTARRNTAVACHWIKSDGQSELLWIVGNLRCFNEQGVVPTNVTAGDVLKSRDENSWESIASVGLLASIAGLFHDFGKANDLFQKMLSGDKGIKTFQPYRHEWVSLRLFCAWVGNRNDSEWLAALCNVEAADEQAMLANVVKDGPINKTINPFDALPPIARVVAWLILSHHRLPCYVRRKGATSLSPELELSDSWLTHHLDALWNAENHLSPDWSAEELKMQWQFSQGTPMRSEVWCAKARKFAQRLLNQSAGMIHIDLNQRFTCHLARLVLMFADHVYSSQPATPGWQSADYLSFANTDRATGKPHQRLDEHNIGVAQNALLMARSLPNLRRSLPAITRHKGFKKRSEQQKYRWQDRAFDAVITMREHTEKQGFFGVNMASTGCGKTFANARVMYALADERKGCRFSVALGLRTLTLQTGDALRKKLTLQDDDLAVLVGSQAMMQLHQMRIQEETSKTTGSDSAEPLMSEHQYVSYDGSLDDGRLSEWLKKEDSVHKLISAPVLVTTIDHLISATEGLRGGRQIAPMLRLLTSDLVLDEPDDFDIDDLPALCRLVNWAGMLGSRVLLSSATLPPALILALFNAYRSGREAFNRACGSSIDSPVCCAWFDETETFTGEYQNVMDFKPQHEAFVTRRINRLAEAEILRRGRLIPVDCAGRENAAVYKGVVESLSAAMLLLHNEHHQRHRESGKTLSLGLIRMANINPLAAISRLLMSLPSPENYHIHYCVYHSQHPLAIRSWIEQRLDETLTRYQQQEIWHIDEIKTALEQHPQQHHLFVVLATSVAEVGRDHDYDWAIAEPSSMRSLIQLAGRIQRHRQLSVKTDNLYILRCNIKALKETGNKYPAYCQPGFESKSFMLTSHDLEQTLQETEYRQISAVPRIQQSTGIRMGSPVNSFVDLEHLRLGIELHGRKGSSDYCAALWWREPLTWCGELQYRKPFRQSRPESQYFLLIEEEDDIPDFYFHDDGPSGRKKSDITQIPELSLAQGVSVWIKVDCHTIYQQLADSFNMELKEVSTRFGEISLPDSESNQWSYHPFLGVFKAE